MFNGLCMSFAKTLTSIITSFFILNEKKTQQWDMQLKSLCDVNLIYKIA